MTSLDLVTQSIILTLLGYSPPYDTIENYGLTGLSLLNLVSREIGAQAVTKVLLWITEHEENRLLLKAATARMYVTKLDDIEVDYMRQRVVLLSQQKSLLKLISNLMQIPIVGERTKTFLV